MSKSPVPNSLLDNQPESEGAHRGASATDAPLKSPDPFDPSSLRLGQDFASSIGVKKALLTVPVKKPDKTWFVRVHPAESYRLQTAVIELKEDSEVYLIKPDLRAELATESTFGVRALFTAVNRQGNVFLWPVTLPGPDGKTMEWHRSSLEAATIAVEQWVRVQANRSLGAYEVFTANGELPDPVWPEQPLSELLRIAFRDRYIDTLEHPVLRRLRGEM